METPSSSLLEQLRRPDAAAALNDFLRVCAPLILSWAKRRGLKETDAEDVTQNVLLELARRLPTYRRGDGQTFHGWLLQITRNKAHDFRTRRATRPLPGDKGLNEAKDDLFVAPFEAAEQQAFLQRLVRQRLAALQAEFGDKTWAAFAGVRLEGKSPAEVAAALGMTCNAVYVAIHKVMTRLRKELDGLVD